MTDEEIAALLGPEEPAPPDRFSARIRAADELLAFAERQAEAGRMEHAMEAAKLADQLARVAKRIADLENAGDVVTNDHGHAVVTGGHGPLHVNVRAAKAHFSEFIIRAARGEEIILCRAGHPVARIAPLKEDAPPTEE